MVPVNYSYMSLLCQMIQVYIPVSLLLRLTLSKTNHLSGPLFLHLESEGTRQDNFKVSSDMASCSFLSLSSSVSLTSSRQSTIAI